MEWACVCAGKGDVGHSERVRRERLVAVFAGLFAVAALVFRRLVLVGGVSRVRFFVCVVLVGLSLSW